MPVLDRLFGRRSQNVALPDDYVSFMSKDGSKRIRNTPDRSMAAVAARHNAAMIYGAGAVPATFGMRQVIEVRDPKTGQFTPVTGDKNLIYDMQTQMGALASFEETGIIGPQALNEDGPNGSKALGFGGSTNTRSGSVTPAPEAGPTVPGIDQPVQSSAPQQSSSYGLMAPAPVVPSYIGYAGRPTKPQPNAGQAGDSPQITRELTPAKAPAAAAQAPAQNQGQAPVGPVPKATLSSVIGTPSAISNLYGAR